MTGYGNETTTLPRLWDIFENNEKKVDHFVGVCLLFVVLLRSILHKITCMVDETVVEHLTPTFTNECPPRDSKR